MAIFWLLFLLKGDDEVDLGISDAQWAKNGKIMQHKMCVQMVAQLHTSKAKNQCFFENFSSLLGPIRVEDIPFEKIQKLDWF